MFRANRKVGVMVMYGRRNLPRHVHQLLQASGTGNRSVIYKCSTVPPYVALQFIPCFSVLQNGSSVNPTGNWLELV